MKYYEYRTISQTIPELFDDQLQPRVGVGLATEEVIQNPLLKKKLGNLLFVLEKRCPRKFFCLKIDRKYRINIFLKIGNYLFNTELTSIGGSTKLMMVGINDCIVRKAFSFERHSELIDLS